jgi:predicted RecB family nuclease
MRFINGELILATADLTKYVQCDHATYLDHATKRGVVKPLAMSPASAMTELIVGKGDDHEHAHLDELRNAGHRIVTIGLAGGSTESLRTADARTLDAMRDGADYIYQAAFFDGRWGGYADFLRRVERPSPQLGGWSYEVVDTKLARAVKSHFLLQLADYSAHVERLQGVAPESMHVVLGNGESMSFRLADYAAYYRYVRASVDRFLVRGTTPAAYPVEFCMLCNWSAHCWTKWNADDHLSLVANIRRTQATRLERGGVATMTALGSVPPTLAIGGVAEASLSVLNHQARMQLGHRQSGTHSYELLPLETARGFLRLPRPSPGDVFFDVEGDPFVGEGLTYLFGAAWKENGEPRSVAWWAHDTAEEAAQFTKVIDFLVARRAADRGAHIYHYGAMEVSALKRLSGRHATRENELDDLLRDEAFVDLSAVIRQAMRISHSGYGLKKVETFYFNREEEGVAAAGGAVLAYEQWLESSDPAMLDAIEKYNREDCLSIMEMQRWLKEIRPAGATWKEPEEARAPALGRIEEDQLSDALFQQLIGTRPLLAHLLYYHRREERPAWWWYFERQKMTTDQLLDDSESIAAITRDDGVAPIPDKRSQIFTFRFPSQEHKFGAGKNAYDSRTGDKPGEIQTLDDNVGTLTLRRGLKMPAEFPSALIPKPEFNTTVLRGAIQRFTRAGLEHGFEKTTFRAGRDILERTPRVRGVADGEPIQGERSDIAAINDVVDRLDESYLFIQGPPGSGKTYAGARVIVGLLQRGKRVGVTSNSHAAIHNLLEEVEKVASESNYRFCGVKKGDDERTTFVSKLPNPMIETTKESAAFIDPAISLFAGTAWLFSDPKMEQTLDYLFIDEAGQVSLANAIAVSTAARNVVLLGDPLQLAQVSQGSHPDGVGASVLEHLLGKDATVPRDHGVFLEQTWRMHPKVCSFISEVVYDSRLRSADECSTQAVSIDGVDETGLRFIAVEHEGNSQSSDEEAECIANEIRRMLRGTFTNSEGAIAPLRPADFLVVAAYNAQVRHLTAAFDRAGLQNVPVGTVDKFQGRQAPIVFFSMATSSGSELPRDIDFLFSRNRLNVAISRARCIATIVASPRLLEVACKTAGQMRLVNGLCRFVEMAR